MPQDEALREAAFTGKGGTGRPGLPPYCEGHEMLGGRGRRIARGDGPAFSLNPITLNVGTAPASDADVGSVGAGDWADAREKNARSEERS